MDAHQHEGSMEISKTLTIPYLRRSTYMPSGNRDGGTAAGGTSVKLEAPSFVRVSRSIMSGTSVILRVHLGSQPQERARTNISIFVSCVRRTVGCSCRGGRCHRVLTNSLFKVSDGASSYRRTYISTLSNGRCDA